MGRINDLMLRIRDSLSDPKGSRWSDDRLLRLIDEGQLDAAIRCNLLRAKAELAIRADINEYDLPSDAYMITRVIASDQAQVGAIADPDRSKLPIRSHNYMDEQDPIWETRVGDGIETIVFDKLAPGKLKVYPIPSVGDAVTETLASSPYGVLTDSTDDVLPSPYGVMTDISTSATLTATFSSHLGVVTEMDSIVASIIVYYKQKPATLTSFALADISEFLSIDAIFDKALKHYVVGMALRDDKDTQNRTVGNEELSFYVAELDKALTLSMMDFTSAEQYNTPHYSTGFEN